MVLVDAGHDVEDEVEAIVKVVLASVPYVVWGICLQGLVVNSNSTLTVLLPSQSTSGSP